MIKIITDSTVYLRRAEAEEMNVRIVPIGYSLMGVRHSEFYSDVNNGFEKYLEYGERITTSQPSPAAFAAAFREETAAGNEVLCITLSSRLSGIYSAAVSAAKELGSTKIHVFDSRQTAGGLYLMVCEAEKLIGSGKKINEIIITLTKIRDKITSCFSVSDMVPLRESGRIGFVRMSVGTILNIKPILLIRDGVVVYDSQARGANDIIEKLVVKIPKDVYSVVINYLGCNSTASNLYNIIKAKFPAAKIRLSRLGPVISAHLGTNVVAVSFITV